MGLPVTYIRSSMLSGKKMCELKMVGEYVLGWTGPSNMKADKGTICHKALEILACAKLAQQNGEDTYFDDEFLGEVTADVYKIDVDDLVDKVYDYYTKAFDHHNWQDADRIDCHTWTWAFLDYKDGLYDPRKLKIVQPEAQFEFPLPSEWADYEYEVCGDIMKGTVFARGTIDLITEVGPGHYEIVDWKTGQRKDWGTGQRKEYSDLMVDIQLRLYQYAAYKLFPDLETLTVTIFYVNDKEKAVSLFFERKDIADTLERLRKQILEMQTMERPGLVKHDRSVKPWLRPCRFCQFAKETFEDTTVTPIHKNNGECMTQCEQLELTFKHRDVDTIMKHMTREGHDFTKYKAPGSTE